MIYLLSRQWFGLHPIELACAAGKPVYCALPLADDLAELEIAGKADRAERDRLHARICPSLLPGDPAAQGIAGDSIGPAAAGRWSHPALRIRPLCHPGPDDPDRTRAAFDRSRQLPAGLVLLCLSIAPRGKLTRVWVPGDRPRPINSTRRPISRASWRLFPGARQPRCRTADIIARPWGDASRFLPAPGFQVFAERGAAWLEMPEKIQWSNSAGTKEERLALEPTVGDVLNDQFHRLVRGDHSLAPTIREALEIARLVSELRRCQPERPSVATEATTLTKEDRRQWGWSPILCDICAGSGPRDVSVWGWLTALAVLVGLALADRRDLQEFSDVR